MAQLTIKEMQPGTSFEGYLFVLRHTIASASNGSPYVNITLQDPTGEIKAIMFNIDPDTFELRDSEAVYLKARVETFNSTKNLKIDAIELLDKDAPQNNPAFYMRSAPLDISVMRTYIEGKIDEIKDGSPLYGSIVETLMDRYRDTFEKNPAAMKYHHEFVNGLIYHTYRMLKSGEALSHVYSDPLPVDRALLYAGIIMHDFGKALTFKDYISRKTNVTDTLLSHIPAADGLIVEQAVLQGYDTDDIKVMKLRHMVLSHHGELEYGSPLKPAFKEAMLLHMIDITDARITQFEDELEKVEPGNISEDRVWRLGVNVYRP